MTATANGSWRIGLAAVGNYPQVARRLDTIDRMMAEAAGRDVAIVCFPETYIPGLRGMDFAVPAWGPAAQEAALTRVRESARRTGVAMVLGMEWLDGPGLPLNVAVVIDRDGEMIGYQTKNQVAPAEEPFYRPGTDRRLFEVDGVPFGITICHEGWRFPESVRWPARRGAKVVFHPHVTGSDDEGTAMTRWGDPDAPYYEKAMLMRATENTVWFASVNCATRLQESATSLIDPDGACVAYVPYGDERLMVHDIDLDRATGYYAHRFDPALYPAG